MQRLLAIRVPDRSKSLDCVQLKAVAPMETADSVNSLHGNGQLDI